MTLYLRTLNLNCFEMKAVIYIEWIQFYNKQNYNQLFQFKRKKVTKLCRKN